MKLFPFPLSMLRFFNAGERGGDGGSRGGDGHALPDATHQFGIRGLEFEALACEERVEKGPVDRQQEEALRLRGRRWGAREEEPAFGCSRGSELSEDEEEHRPLRASTGRGTGGSNSSLGHGELSGKGLRFASGVGRDVLLIGAVSGVGP